jgi:hypothetical protein
MRSWQVMSNVASKEETGVATALFRALYTRHFNSYKSGERHE